MAASESVEHRTLVRYIDKLTLAFESAPVSITNELLAKGLISPEIHTNALTLGIGNDVKASQLVKCVMDQIHVCPGKYCDFYRPFKRSG